MSDALLPEGEGEMETWTLVWCPRCDQGWVQRVRINALERIAYICDECDLLWHSSDEIGSVTLDFATFMESHGRRGVWGELTVLPHINPLVQPPHGAGETE